MQHEQRFIYAFNHAQTYSNYLVIKMTRRIRHSEIERLPRDVSNWYWERRKKSNRLFFNL